MASYDPNTLPAHIPDGAREYYMETSLSGERDCDAVCTHIFFSDRLADVWITVGQTSSDFQYQFTHQLLKNLKLIPPGGVATAKYPGIESDEKLMIIANQRKIDNLRKEIKNTATLLASLVDEIKDLNPNNLPPEINDTNELLVTAKEIEGDYAQELSDPSLNLPTTSSIVKAIAYAVDHFPCTESQFGLHPRFSSNKSGWRDFIRCMREAIATLNLRYGQKLILQQRHWVALIHTCISDTISVSSINSALRDSTQFSWGQQQ